MPEQELAEMAQACVEMMRSMGAMMGMPGGMPTGGVGGMGGMGSMMAMGGWLGLFVLLLLLIGVAVVLALVWSRRPSRDGTEVAGPLTELDLRYARGEVDRDTYLQVRHDLQEARS